MEDYKLFIAWFCAAGFWLAASIALTPSTPVSSKIGKVFWLGEVAIGLAFVAAYRFKLFG